MRGGLVSLGTADIGTRYAALVTVRRIRLVVFAQYEFVGEKEKESGR